MRPAGQRSLGSGILVAAASVAVITAQIYGLRERHFDPTARFVPFSAETRMSRVDMNGARVS